MTRRGAWAIVILPLLPMLAACRTDDHAVAKSDDPIPGALVLVRDTEDDGAGELFVVNADGSDARVAVEGEGFYSPATSPDGQMIAAIQDADSSDSGVAFVLIDGATGAVNTISDVPVGSYNGLDWSPTGDALAFSGVDFSRFAQGDGGYADLIYVSDLNTGETRLLFEDSPDGAMNPSWSHDGKRIAYTFDGAIHVANRDGAGEHAASPVMNSVFEPAWSPVDDRIAFTGYEAEFAAIYVVNADGSGLVKISGDVLGAGNPAWSPDGQWIAFAAFGASGNQLRIVRPDGSDLRTIDLPEDINHPVWSPDGEWIAFATVYAESDGPITATHANLINPFADDPDIHTLVRDLAASEIAWLPT